MDYDTERQELAHKISEAGDGRSVLMYCEALAMCLVHCALEVADEQGPAAARDGVDAFFKAVYEALQKRGITRELC